VRIVSLLPSATELLFAVGAGEDVVGVTFECDYPPEARTRRIVSTSALPEGLSAAEIDAAVAERLAAGADLYHLDAGALRGLEPDLVVTQDLCAVCAVDVSVVGDALDYLGCSADVLTLDPHTLEDVLESVTTLGAAVDREEQAAALLRSLRRRVQAVREAVAGLPPVPVVLLEWTDPPFTAGHWVPEMVEAAGGRDLLGRTGEKSYRTTWPAVEKARASALVVAPCGYDLDGSVRLAEELVRSARPGLGLPVWAVDANASFARPGPRLVDGIEALAALLHPAGSLPLEPRLAKRVA
jgi:iron complex transport system substrate-binding protein